LKVTCRARRFWSREETLSVSISACVLNGSIG
jgi:hypothetical protein